MFSSRLNFDILQTSIFLSFEIMRIKKVDFDFMLLFKCQNTGF